MVANKTYYWRIDEKNAGGTTTGNVWSFTTIVRRTLTSSSTTGGDVTTPGEGAFSYDNGTNASIIATADAHYHFVNWTGTGVTAGKVASPTSASTTITMDGDYTVVANFAIDTFTLDYTAGTNGSLTGNTAQVVNYGANGTAVTAVPNIGYHFVKWSDDSTANPRTDTGVTANIAVTATFTQNVYTLTINKVGNGTVTTDKSAPYHYGDVVTLGATADLGWTFAGFDPGAVITMNSDKTVTATFTQNVYTLTINKVGNGTVTTDKSAPYHYGDVVTLGATADLGWTFAGFDPGAVITMNSDKTVTATFTQNVYTLTINKVGSGTVTADKSAPYHYGDVVTLSATADLGWTFAGFDPGAVITMNSDKTVTATFTQNVYTLTINKVGSGTVTTDKSAPYHYGDVVTLGATADLGWTFAGFNPGAVVTMDDNKTVTATFTQNVYTLTINKVGSGTVTADKSAPYHYGDVVTLGATADLGWTFAGFDPGAVITMNSDKTVTATFTINQMTISGHITKPDANIPAVGVFIEANNGGNSATTDVNGYYQLTVAYGWSGNVALSKTGYIFEPNGREYINVTANQNDNYIVRLKTFIISGHAVDAVTHEPLADVLVTPDNDGGPFTTKYYGGGHDTTDANGYYEVVVNYNWSGNVVPSKYAYAFMPSSITYANVTEDKAAEENYAGTLLTYKISGHIKNACQVPIKGVLVAANNGGSSAITDVNGFYEVWVSYNWSGTVTPGNKPHYTFEPAGIEYVNVLENKTGQDYAATNIYDLDCDGYIDYGDIVVISENWLRTGPNIPGDFDKNNTVNFLDFAEFATVWQDN
jgi:hypothetical protein